MPRGRPKGSKNNIKVDVSTDVEESVKEAVVKIRSKVEASAPIKYQRDESGLLSNVEYHFNEDGSIDWRKMVKDEHLFPNRSWFESRKKDIPRTIEGLKDHQLLIKLSGIKELAKLRGFFEVDYNIIKCEEHYVAVKCTMSFMGNYETEGMPIEFSDMANATLNNTSSFATKFLETIACNRAFVRCVRNFLNIHIVGDDEIDKSNNKNPSFPTAKSLNSSLLSPQGALKKLAEVSGYVDFNSFMNYLRKMHKEGIYQIDESLSPANWNSYDDIPPKQSRELLKILKDGS